MATIQIITHTDPNNGSFSLNPRQKDGPGYTNARTNLTLIGSGSLRYGEDHNENFLHLLENFAAPEKTTTGSPAVGTGEPDWPEHMDPAKAVKGQLWYNSTRGQIMVYDGSAWSVSTKILAQTSEPDTAETGDMWYDTSINELMVYNGSSWEMAGAQYLRLDGTSTMTGNIDVGSNKIVNLADPTNPQDGVTKSYTDAHISDDSIHLTAAQNTLLDGLAGTLEAVELNALDGFDPTGADDTGSVQEQLDKKVSVNGDTMSGPLVLPNSSPTIDNHATRKKYVDDQITAATDGVLGSADRFVRFWSTQSASASDGDMHVSGSTVYVRAGGAWRQIYPAVYS